MGTLTTTLKAARHHRDALLLALLCFIAFFVNSGALRPDIMETRNLETAREIVESGDWMVPRMNGEYRLEKPPLPTWIAAAVESVAPDCLPAQRAMSGLAGVMLVVFCYLIALRTTERRDVAFLSVIVLLTCYQIILQARTATWDIYCHAFMAGGIYYLWRGLYEEGHVWKHMLLAGALTGLSFMCKGPVSLYALLLPWLIAVIAVRRPRMSGRVWPLLAMIVVAVVISSWWYVYIILTHPEAAGFVIHKETGAWKGHNVRPWYYYWRFFLETGIWAPLVLAGLCFPYFRRRMGRLTPQYTVTVLWVVAQLVLLSFMPEKKMRYLLPMMLPCSYLAALMLIYLADRYRSALPRRIALGIAALFAVAEVFGMPIVARTFSNPDYNSIAATRTDPRLKGLKFYSPKGEELRIEIVYASAHIIRPLDYRAPHIADSLRAKAPCVLLSHGDIAAAMPEDAFTAVDTLRIGRYNNSNRSRFARHGNDSNFIYTVTLITPKHGSN